MITREEAKKVLLESMQKQITEGGKSENDVAIISPKKGKDAWTYKEVIESIQEDKCLEDSECNLIDDYLHYLEYKEQQELSKLRDRLNK